MKSNKQTRVHGIEDIILQWLSVVDVNRGATAAAAAAAEIERKAMAFNGKKSKRDM